MANIRYTLFGEEFTESQGKMMIRICLFLLCKEDINQFQIQELDVKLPIVKRETDAAHVQTKTARAARGVWYQLFGEKYESSQSWMMYHVFEQIFLKDPGLVDWAADHLHCASWTDFTSDENRDQDMPSQFKSSRILQIEGKRICIGSGYNLKAKLNLIDRLIEKAKLPAGVFAIYPTDSDSNEFKRQIGQDNLADLLWDTIETTDLAADAEGRIVNRSLLKYEGKCYYSQPLKSAVLRTVTRFAMHRNGKNAVSRRYPRVFCDFRYATLTKNTSRDIAL